MSDKNIEENNYSISNFELYPPVMDFYDSGRQYEIYKEKTNSPTFLNNGMNEGIKLDTEEDTYEINSDFFGSLLGKNNYDLNKEKKINTISKIIRKSKLMAKLEKEYSGSNKKNDLAALSNMCAKHLSFMELKRGKVLFKIGDKGDRFYFILSGKITILKPREIKTKMNLEEYLYYLLILIKEKEDYLFHESVLNNCTQIPITTAEEVKSVYKIIFLINLKKKLENGTIDNNIQLKNYFDKNYQSFHEYNLEKNDLELLEQKKLKIGGNKQWNIYILQNCNLTKSDLRILGRYKQYNEKKNIVCYAYDSFLYLGPGFFFGDAALEVKVNKRNATIRAEEDTVLGFLKSVDYSNMIAPQRKIEKMKEINFLVNNFFFKYINIPIFEKNLFHLFTLNEKNRGSILFDCGSIPKYLIFLKEGILSLNIQCSIIEIINIIENICNRFINKYSEEVIKKKIITKEKINILKGYIDNKKELYNLKNFTKEFIKEINKKRNFQIAVFDGVETIGLEEIFLDIPYITQAIVTSEKIIFYKFAIEKLQTNLLENHHINYFYMKSAVNKVFSLIERLNNLKQNYIDIAKMRHENPNSFRTKKLPILKNININLFNHNNIETYSTIAHNSSASRIIKKMIKISRNIGTEIKKKEKIKQILSYSENKTKVDKINNINNNANSSNILKYKSPLSKNTYMKNNIFLSIILDKNKDKDNKSYTDKNQNIKIKKITNINNNKDKNSNFSNFINYIRKAEKNNIIDLKINDNEESNNSNSGKVKLKRLESALNNKSQESIKIGNKLFTLDALKKKIRKSDCNIFVTSKMINYIQTTNYSKENRKNSFTQLNKKELNSNSSIESDYNSVEKDTSRIELKREYSSNISEKIKKFNYIFVPLIKKEDNNMYKKNLNINTNNPINNNDNFLSSLLPKPNTSRDNNKLPKNGLILQKNISFNHKNKKFLLQKLLLNNKSKSKKNLFKNNLLNIKIDSDNEKNQNNYDTSFNNKIFNEKEILPTISKKNLDLNNSNDLKFLNKNHYISQKELIPDIIKNFYKEKKMKGYVSLIPKKEFNTLFLRKFHKKYNQSEKNIKLSD